MNENEACNEMVCWEGSHDQDAFHVNPTVRMCQAPRMQHSSLPVHGPDLSLVSGDGLSMN